MGEASPPDTGAAAATHVEPAIAAATAQLKIINLVIVLTSHRADRAVALVSQTP